MSGHAGIVVGNRRHKRQTQGLTLAGGEGLGFRKAGEDSGRLAELALGRLAVDLHDLLAGEAAGVGHGDIDAEGVLFFSYPGSWLLTLSVHSICLVVVYRDWVRRKASEVRI